MRLLQIGNRAGERRVGVVDDGKILLLEGVDSIYGLAQKALEAREKLAPAVKKRISPNAIAYDDIYFSTSDWRILPAIDHPHEPARCLISGTGLTHMKSAQNRQAMHKAGEAPTDSMKIYEWGVEGGRPAPGQIGVAPEWFYKGCGTSLRAHGEPLAVPPHAEDGGEEAEIVGIYMIDSAGNPRRIGMAMGNEFSDHKFERKNYLYLAASKLMSCAIGPELVVDAVFDKVPGEAVIERDDQVFWRRDTLTGESVMAHSLANLEHHHFKHAAHRRPGDVHIYFLGASAFSFGEGIILKDGDVMRISFEGFGRALRNPLVVDRSPQKLMAATAL
ncbi:MAG TPA: AraD1 family protein [Candidatus Acidoferrum sp.]|nr:AraD1 family protein [Candidatus Acidoferrum sp.]